MKPEVLQRFIVQGYISIPPSVGPEAHARVADGVLACGLSVPNPKYHGMPSPTGDAAGNNLIQAVPAVAGTACMNSPELRDVLSGLLGSGYRFHPHTRAHLRQKGAQTTMWHIDSYKGYWQSRYHVPHHLMVCYYPQAVSMEMGPTELLPGTQYYRGDHDGESYGRGVLPNLNDQLTSFSTTPRAFTCVAGTIMVMHYDLWHRALECSDEHSNRLMLKFAAWRTDPSPATVPHPLPKWDLVEKGGNMTLDEIIVQPSLGFLMTNEPITEYKELYAEDVRLSDHIRESLIKALKGAEEKELSSAPMPHRNSHKDNFEKDASRRNRVGMKTKHERDVAVVGKALFVAAMDVLKELKEKKHVTGPEIVMLIQVLKTVCPPRATAIVNKLRVAEFVRLRTPIWNFIWKWMHGIRIPPEHTLEPEALANLQDMATHGNEATRLCACYELAEAKGGESTLRSIMSTPTLKTSVRRTAWYGYIASSNAGITPLASDIGAFQIPVINDIDLLKIGEYAEVLPPADIRAMDGFDSELWMSPRDPNREIRYLVESSRIKCTQTFEPESATLVFYLCSLGPTGISIGLKRVALENVTFCCIDREHSMIATTLLVQSLMRLSNSTVDRIVAARGLSQLSAQSISNCNREQKHWIIDNLAFLVTPLLHSLSNDPDRYVKSHVFETLVNFLCSVSLSCNLSQRSEHHQVERSWALVFKSLPREAKVHLSMCSFEQLKCATEAHELCRQLSCRRKCPISTPDDPF